MSQTQAMEAMIDNKDQVLEQIEGEVSKTNQKLHEEIEKLNTSLKVKSSGNAMLGALMRGFKQKLEEKMAESQTTIQMQEQEIV